MNRDLTKRTPGEELWLWRRHGGLTTAEAAARLGMSRSTYWTRERDRSGIKVIHYHLAYVPAADLLRLARRRMGWGMHGTAAQLGCSHVVMLRREAAGNAGLLAFWRRRGFKFPEESMP